MSADPGQPTVVSLFAGTGGSSLGYKLAGFKCRLAVEWDEHAVKQYRMNFPTTTVYQGDVGLLSDQEALRLAELEPGQLDVLDGSPPCQGFSTEGARVMDDPRNQLFREYVRLLRAFRPRAMVMENVSGMVKGKMRLIFADALRALRESGYQVSCRLVNAKYLGVPQSRERVIFIGVRDDLGVTPSHPRPQSKVITVREAFKGVPDDGTGDRVLPTTKIWKAMKNVRAGGKDPEHHSHMRLHPDQPSPTICKGMAGLGHYHYWHPFEHRVITVAECKRLCSFPDDFIFIGKVSEQWSRLGNCVPPLLMKAVAEHIRETLLPRCS